ncbi:MAG: SusC/RagA family TonB-linked outer membrane protein [Flavisolibacter sp.]
MRLVIFMMALALLTHSKQVFAQSKITVKGVIKDAGNQSGKSGVTIAVGKPPKPIGTTDENGNFSVTVDAGAELTFTYAGFETVRRTVISGKVLEINMKSKDNPMQEIVVQGFKAKVRETSTGSSTVLSGKTVQDVPVSNVIQLLQGKVAGLNIQNNTGSPGGMGTINLRGVSSIAISSDGFLTPTSPLFVIDGVPVDPNTNFEYGFQGGGPGISPLALIPPEDIEQFDILRDAAATSQYGSRGAYGVIIITTKRGRSKVPIVAYSGSYFMSTVPKLRPILGGKEERMNRINAILKYDTTLASAQALINQTPFLSDSLNPYYNNATNWQNYFFRNTSNQQHNISIRGGDEKFNYKTNLNYFSESGIVENTGFKRYSLGMNATYSPTTNFKMSVNLTGLLGQKQNGSGVGLVQTGIAQGAATSSLLPPPSLFSENNSALATARVKNNNKTSAISTSLDLQYEPIKGIRFINLLSYNFNSGTSDIFKPSTLNNGSSQAYSYNDHSYTVYDRTSINYIKTFNDLHNFNVSAFNEINSYGFRAGAVRPTQTANDQIEGPLGYNYSLTGGGTLNNIKDTRQHGYGGSFSYNYDQKYVLDLSYRFDGLSTNGPSQGYSQNPSVSARWNFYKESFFDKVSWLSFGSLRAGWGRSILPTGSIFDVYGKYIVGLPYNNNPTVTIDYSTVPNTSFLPETQTSLSGALETGLFDNRLQTTFETYYRSIDNQVMDVALSNISGFGKLKTNAVSVVNYGLEWTAKYQVFKPTNPLQWSLTVTGALNRAVLTKLPDDLRQMTIQVVDGNTSVPVVYRVGRSPFSNLLYNTVGVYNSTADVPVNIATGERQQLGRGNSYYFQGGDARWTDVNGDYIIDENDLLPIGDPVPKVTGGISSFNSYKDFQLTINASYTLNRDVLNTSQAAMFQNYNNPTILSALVPINDYNYWIPSPGVKGSGTVNAQYPNPYDFTRAGVMQPYRTNQTLFLEDGSYWKINNIILAYNMNRNFIKRFGMTSCRLTLTANNVYTFSNYSGPDPELVTALGRDNSGGYPNARTYAVGINIQF